MESQHSYIQEQENPYLYIDCDYDGLDVEYLKPDPRLYDSLVLPSNFHWIFLYQNSLYIKERLIQSGHGVKAMRNIFYNVPLKNFEKKAIEKLNRKL